MTMVTEIEIQVLLSPEPKLLSFKPYRWKCFSTHLSFNKQVLTSIDPVMYQTLLAMRDIAMTDEVLPLGSFTYC